MKTRALLMCLLLVAAVTACKKTESYENTSTTSTTDTYASANTGTTGATGWTGTTGATAATGTTTIADKDKDFITDAGKGGKAEVDVATDALKNAQNADVKAFAQKLVDDHTKGNDKLASLATSKGVTLPSEMEAKMKETKERLMKLTGKSFDQAFVTQMIEDHTATIKEFEDEAKSGTDADTKKFAEETLPTLREHLSKAKSLQAKIGKK